MPTQQDEAAVERRRLQNRLAQRRRRQRRAMLEAERQNHTKKQTGTSDSEPQDPNIQTENCDTTQPAPSRLAFSYDQMNSGSPAFEVNLYDDIFLDRVTGTSPVLNDQAELGSSSDETAHTLPALQTPVTNPIFITRNKTLDLIQSTSTKSPWNSYEGKMDSSTDQSPKRRRSRMILHVCAERGDESLVELLLHNGAEIDAQDQFGRTALHYAVKHVHKTVVTKLLELGADTEVVDCNGHTPLHVAVDIGSHEMVLALIEEGADLNATLDF